MGYATLSRGINPAKGYFEPPDEQEPPLIAPRNILASAKEKGAPERARR
jgi:hypothetical protein